MSMTSNLKTYQLQIGVFYMKLVRVAPEQSPVSIPESVRPATVSVEDRRMQIAAAQGRIVTDKRQGKQTPDWIIALAKEDPEYELQYDSSPYKFKG